MMAPHRNRPIGLVLLKIILAGVAGFALIFVLPEYLLLQATFVGVYILGLYGMNLLIGYSGQISLAHSLFFAIGAYVTAIAARADWAFLTPLLPASALCFAVGLLLGIPALRFKGLYLAIATFIVALCIPPVLIRLESLTGGNTGLILPMDSVPSVTGIGRDQFLYLVVLIFVIVFGIACRNMVTGRLGRGLHAQREHEFAAASLGVNLASLRVLAFAWSGAFAGIAGGLYAYITGYVSPEAFTFNLAIALLVGSIVGGAQSIVVGAVLGAAFIQFVPQWAGEVNQGIVGMIYGLAVVIVVLVAPNGVAGLVREVAARIRRWLPATQRRDVPVPRGTFGAPRRERQSVEQ